VQAHGADGITNLTVRRDALRDLLERWVLDGRLQTFEDRERFRLEAKMLLNFQDEPPK